MNQTFDRYASLAFFLVGAAFVWESRKISATSYGSSVGPDIFPMGLGILMMLLSLRLFYEVFRSRPDGAGKPSLDYKRFGIILGTAVLYAFFLEDIGYVIGTTLFLYVGFQVIEPGKRLMSLAVSALFSAAVYYVFVVLLEGSLPGFPAWFS
ncbi:tripartite tricarboxylate transporter TctB family protein [Paenibacillus aurantius]|uniref:Tripartite tricarboxylate transporter TctB family protein n=1 Tax=Paenibacillus aurantius TaxID=2918900 RepID=A0AA96LGU2_9BACL|nr:tripartite tricarboxylate transporter TctB family protein [Paenibacillus aurantius]WNQ12753.1 tripartite tricarboxylate transporter TctB family protein [Paenibacillus aurantius]